MNILVLILAAFFGTIFGFALFSQAVTDNDKNQKLFTGFLSTIFLICGLGSILWIVIAPVYNKETDYPIYRMDNATVIDNNVVHDYYLGYINASGEKINVTSYFKQIEVDPSKYEAVEINKTGYSGGIYWEAGITTTVRLKSTIESK